MSWKKVEVVDSHIYFSSDSWLCGDWDQASFCFDKNKKEITVDCISGVTDCSYVKFTIWDAPRNDKLNLSIEEFPGEFNPDNLDSLFEYAKWASDRICSLFCDKITQENHDEESEEYET